MYVCMFVCMYVWMCVWMCVFMYGMYGMHVCMNVCINVCMLCSMYPGSSAALAPVESLISSPMNPSRAIPKSIAKTSQWLR